VLKTLNLSKEGENRCSDYHLSFLRRLRILEYVCYNNILISVNATPDAIAGRGSMPMTGIAEIRDNDCAAF